MPRVRTEFVTWAPGTSGRGTGSSRSRYLNSALLYRQRMEGVAPANLRTFSPLLESMREAGESAESADMWKPIPDTEERFSTGTADFDRLVSGGFPRGGTALFTIDETVGLEDLDLILSPTYLNFLYQSRGIMAALPSRDSPHRFRARLIRYVSRRRFDSRVRIVDYAGEDEGLSYVVNIRGPHLSPKGGPDEKTRERAIAQMVTAERAVRGSRGKPFLELTNFELFDVLLGTQTALRMYFHGIKRTRTLGNLGIGILATGLGVEAGVRRMADMEFDLHRDEVGLIIRGVRPSFRGHVVAPDPTLPAPHVAFVPRPG